MSSKKKRKNAATRRTAEAAAPVPVSQADERSAGRTLSAAVSLAAILLLSAALRLVWLDAAVGGFHCFNEAHYTLIAKNFFHSSFLLPTPDGSYVFLETPPLYSYLLHAVFRVAGVSVIAGRLLSVVSSLALVLATFLLARRLFGEKAGLAAALLLAVSPVAVLTGRNIQTDSTLLALLVASLFFFWRAEEEGSRRDFTLAGALAGLALFTKLFAAIALAAVFAWELATKRSLRRALEKSRWQAAVLALSLPGLFYGYHALRDFAYLRHDVAGGAAAATTLPKAAAEWGAIGIEVAWAFSPVIAVALLAGAAAALVRRSRQTLFALFPLAGFGLFYLFVHKHSYYLLAMLPFAAALAGRLLAGIRPRALRLSGLAVIALSGSFWTLVDLTSMKAGFREFAEFGRRAADLPGARHELLLTREMRDSYAPVLSLYDPKARLTTIEDAPAEADGRLRISAENLYLVKFVPASTEPPPAGWLFSRTRYGVAFFGWNVLEAHANPHFFRQGRYFAEKTGSALDFGRKELKRYPALALLPVPPGAALYRTAAGLEARRVE